MMPKNISMYILLIIHGIIGHTYLICKALIGTKFHEHELRHGTMGMEKWAETLGAAAPVQPRFRGRGLSGVVALEPTGAVCPCSWTTCRCYRVDLLPFQQQQIRLPSIGLLLGYKILK